MDITSNYGDAMSRLAPGTFVPDIGAGAGQPKSEPLTDAIGATGGAASSFKDTLSQMLNDVNTKMVTADQKTQDLALGKTHDMEGVIRSVEEGQLSMEFTMAIRNKLLDAYQEIQRTQV